MYRLKFMYIYIYTHAIKSIFGPNGLLGVQNLVQVIFVFCFFFFSKIFFSRENGIKTEEKHTNYHFWGQSLVHFMLRILGPSFDPTVDQVMTQLFWHFWAISKDVEPPFCLECFNAKIEIFKPTQKQRNTIWKHNCANWFVCPCFLRCCFCFLQCFQRNEKHISTKKQTKTKKESGPQNANKKTAYSC